jgi:hypothetical protein
VDQAVVVGGVEGVGDLADQVDRAAGVHRPVLQGLAQVGAVDQAHVDVEPAVDLAEVVDRDDVGLAQPGRDAGLAAEPAGVLRVVGQDLREELDGDVALVAGVVREVDLAHAAGAQQHLQPVVPEIAGEHLRPLR